MSRTEGRRDERHNRKFKVWLSLGTEPMFAELASAENVSSCGVRVRTELPWKANARVFVKLPEGGMWTRARIAYCRRLKGECHALGLEFYEGSHRYNLTFRCIHCGSYQTSANFRSDRQESEAEIQARIYQVQCAGCGRRGEACGFSALHILRYKSVETPSEAKCTAVVAASERPTDGIEEKPIGSRVSRRKQKAYSQGGCGRCTAKSK